MTDNDYVSEEIDMTKTVTRRMRVFITVLCLTLAGPLAASRLAFEQVGQITAIDTESRDIKIDGVSHRLAKKVEGHSTEKTSDTLSVDALHKGAKIGYTRASTGKDKKPEITSVWLLPAQPAQ